MISSRETTIRMIQGVTSDMKNVIDEPKTSEIVEEPHICPSTRMCDVCAIEEDERAYEEWVKWSYEDVEPI
jgi:hypothetical protein